MTTASDPALEKKIEDAEEEIKDVKLKIKQVEAALEGLRAETDEARDAAFGKAGIYAVRGEQFLEQQLLALENQLTAKESNLAELRKKENLLLERASRDSNVAAVTMFSIKATIVACKTAPAHYFRSVLANKLANLKSENGIVVYGSCDRNNEAITVDFLLDTMGHRTIVAGVIDDITKIQHAGGYLSSRPDETSQQLEKCIAKSVADPSSIKEWQYSPQAGSPDRKLKRDGREFEEADAELMALFPKRTKSDDADSVSSKQTQNAHVLWEATTNKALKEGREKQTDKQIKGLIKKYNLTCQESPGAEMGRLQKLTWQYPYQHHRTYDKAHFYFSWCFFGNRDAGWELHGVPKFINATQDTHPPELRVKNIPDSDWLTWQRALTLRKACTHLMQEHQISVSELQAEWNGKSEDGATMRRSCCSSYKQ